MSLIQKLFKAFESIDKSTEVDDQTVTSFDNKRTLTSAGEEKTITSAKKEQKSENLAPQNPYSLLSEELRQTFSFASKNQLSEGDIIGGEYVVEKVFGGKGESGMGVVYLVKNRKSPDPIVLKTIQPEIHDSDSFGRFYKEIQAWISVGWHPNIVGAIFAEVIDDTLYVGADYIAPDENGRNNLTHYLSNSSPVSNHQILRWSAQFIYAMQYAQLKGLRAHRDIKPDNIMIDAEGNVKVTDFGLASLFENNYFQSTERRTRTNYFLNNINLTEDGTAMGTIPFMAPEQFEDVRSVDHRADIYAFGIILYMLLTGGRYPYRKPFAGKDVFSAYYEMHRAQPHQPIQSTFSFIVDKCLMKRPSERYQDYEQLLNDFSKVANQLNINLPSKPQIEDNRIEELYMQALSFRGLKQFEKALQAISSYLKARPESDDGWALKGRILLELDNIPEAIEATGKSIDLYPYNSTPWNNLGLMLNRIGNYEKSVSAFKKALEIDPSNSGAWMNMAQPLQSLGWWDAITPCLENAFALTPTKKSLHFNATNHVRFMLEAGETEEAFNLSKLLAKYDSDNQTNWHNLGLIHQMIGDYDEAINCFHSVEALDSNDHFCLSNLALLYAKINDFNKAVIYSNKAIQKLGQSKTDWGSWQNIGKCYLTLGRTDEAINSLQKAVQSSQGDTSVLMDLGIALETINRNNEAIEVFVKILEKDSDNAPAYNSLALTQNKVGQYDFALHNYEEGIKALSRKLVRNLINSRSNRIIKHKDIPYEHWMEYAIFGAFYLASLDENIEKAAWLTGEQAIREEQTQQHEGLYWIDKVEAGKTTRIFLPNYFNTFVLLLSETQLYPRLIIGIGKVLQNEGKHSEAQSYFEEASYFRN